MGQKKLLGGFRGVKFTFACSFLYLLFSNIIFSILQYINQRKENRARWVGIMQTTTVPGNRKLYLVFNLQCIYGEQGHQIMKTNERAGLKYSHVDFNLFRSNQSQA